MKNQHYSDEFREQALAKVFSRSGKQTIRSVAADLHMSLGTLRNWMKRAVAEQTVPTLKAKRATELTRAERLLVLQQTHGLSEEALNAWCRERGLFAHDLTQWHSEFCDTAEAPGRREDGEELRQLRLANAQLRLANAQLQRDLNRKEKALAEAAALLVLQKKYRALWAAEDV